MLARPINAAHMALVACPAVSVSMSDNAVRIGRPSGSPVIAIMPDSACNTGSYPGRSRIDPCSPYADIDT